MKIKKLTAIVLAVLMLFGLTACGNTSVVLTIDGENITPGLYRAFMFNCYYEAANELESTTEDVWKQTVDGVAFSDYIEQLTLEACKEYIAVDRKFDELGLTLTSEETSESKAYYEYIWEYYGETFENNGISQDTMIRVGVNSTKKTRIFEYYYYEGGSKAVAKAETDDYIEENYIAFKSISGSMLDSDSVKVTGETYTAIKAIYETYYNRALEGVDFNTLIDEYEAYVAEANSTTATDPTTKVASDYYTVIKNTSTSLSEEFLAAFNSAKTGDVKMVEDDSYLYIIQKLDVMDLIDSYEALTQAAISDLKSSEFEEETATWYTDYSVKSYSSALNKYSPEKMKLS